jgi:6,7-dimethyl-8-ribityllumazine synthase
MNILIVEARYHPDVADALVDGATAALEKGGARFERVSMPGVLELPAAIAIAARSARPFDGYVALGCVTGPSHIADMYYVETLRGLTALGAVGIALGSGIVLAGDEGAAHDLAMRQDLGGDAARACLALCTFADRQGYQR